MFSLRYLFFFGGIFCDSSVRRASGQNQNGADYRFNSRTANACVVFNEGTLRLFPILSHAVDPLCDPAWRKTREQYP